MVFPLFLSCSSVRTLITPHEVAELVTLGVATSSWSPLVEQLALFGFARQVEQFAFSVKLLFLFEVWDVLCPEASRTLLVLYFRFIIIVTDYCEPAFPHLLEVRFASLVSKGRRVGS